MEISYDEFKQREGTYVLIGFGALFLKEGAPYNIEAFFRKTIYYVYPGMKLSSTPVQSLNWFFDKNQRAETLIVKINYARICSFAIGSIFNKDTIEHLQECFESHQLNIDPQFLAYRSDSKDYLKIPEDSKLNELFLPAFWKQSFCIFTDYKKKYLIPSVEILRAYYGISSELLKACIFGMPFPIYNKSRTQELINETEQKIIVLRQGIPPELCTGIAYRMYTDEFFEKSYRAVYKKLQLESGDRGKTLEIRFPNAMPFKLSTRVLTLIPEKLFLVTTIEKIEDGYVCIDDLIVDTDSNNAPAKIDENTRLIEKKAPAMIVPEQSKNRPEDSDNNKIDSRVLKTEFPAIYTYRSFDLPVPPKRFIKEVLKSHRQHSPGKINAMIDHVSTNELSGGQALVGPLVFTKEKAPVAAIDPNVGFNLSAELYEALKKHPQVADTDYIRDASHNQTLKLVEIESCNSNKNWPYILKIKKNRWKQPRRICVLEILIRDAYFYVIEVEKRVTEKSNSLGIVNLKDRQQLSTDDVLRLIKLILKIKGKFEAANKHYDLNNKDFHSNKQFIVQSIRHDPVTEKTAGRIVAKLTNNP